MIVRVDIHEEFSKSSVSETPRRGRSTRGRAQKGAKKHKRKHTKGHKRAQRAQKNTSTSKSADNEV